VLSFFLIAFVSDLNAIQSVAAPEFLKIEPDRHNSTVITIHWCSPKETYGQINSYTILYSKNKTLNDRKWARKEVKGDVTTTIVDGLSPHSNYFFKIKARIDQELSPASQVQEFKTPVMKSLAVPKFSKVVHSTDPSKVTLHFLPPSKPNGQIKGYYIFYSEDMTFPDEKWDKIYVDGDKTSAVLDNLSPESTYFMKMQVKTDHGLGLTTSSLASFTTKEGTIHEEIETKPTGIKSQYFTTPKITKVDLLTDPTRATLHFLPPTKPNGKIIGYYIFYSEDMTFPDEKCDKVYIEGDVTSGELYNLSPRSTYFIKMQVKTDQGLGPFTSGIAKFNTKLALVDEKFGTKPEAMNKSNNNQQSNKPTNQHQIKKPLPVKSESLATPSIVEVLPSTYDPTFVTVKWLPPKQPNGQINGYYIFYSKDIHLPDLKWDKEFMKGVQTTGQLMDLEPNSKYFFKIQVKTDEGLSSSSDVFEFITDN